MTEQKHLQLGDLTKMRDVHELARGNYHGRCTTLAGPTEIGFSITAGNGKRKPVIRLSIGPGILDRLRWVGGDRLQVLYDDKFLFMRRSNDGHYSVHQKKSKHGRVTVTVTLIPPMPFSSQRTLIRMQKADFIYKEDGLLIAFPVEEKIAAAA